MTQASGDLTRGVAVAIRPGSEGTDVLRTVVEKSGCSAGRSGGLPEPRLDGAMLAAWGGVALRRLIGL